MVFTAGRTGSQLICQNLLRYFNAPLHNDFDDNFISGVVHTHNPMYMPPTNDFYCIISRRRNKFNAILSMLIAEKTGEYSEYSNKKINPMSIDTQKFKELWVHYTIIYKIIDDRIYRHYNLIFRVVDHSVFKEPIEIYYEDLIEDPTHLFSLFNVNHKIELLTPKSPGDYYNLIDNIDELENLYHQLEQTPLTLDRIDRVSKNFIRK